MKSKRILNFVIIVIIIISLTACGSNSEKSSGGIFKGKSLSTSDLSINSFIWKTEASKCYGSNCYVFSLENNSEYDIIGVDITYRVKDSVTEEQLKVYDSFMKEHDGYIEEDDSPKDITLRGSSNTLLTKGENVSNIILSIGFKDWSWYTSPTAEQFDLMEVKELQIGVIGKDNKLYIAYYDFVSNNWKFDTVKKDVDTWSNSSLAKMLEKPNDKHRIITKDEDDDFSFYSYGITKDTYKQYVDNIKALGFEDEYPTSTYYSGENSDGYNIRVDYSEENNRMYVNPYKFD